MRPKRILLISVILLALVALAVYLQLSMPSVPTYELNAATTTSVKDTGLMDELLTGFRDWAKARKNVVLETKYVGVGTGAAIRIAERGDVDFILVHAPPLEKTEVEKGILVCRVAIAYNFFVLIGPEEDPAGVRELELSKAFRRIFDTAIRGATKFVSRGDDSGTHQKEQALWALAGINYTDITKRFSGSWYLETGKGMGDTLLVAHEKRAYTLTDIGTWLAFRNRLPTLKLLVSKSVSGLNVYSVLIPHPEIFPKVKFELARLFEDYVTGSEGQTLILKFGVDRYGEPLFTPISSINLTNSDPVTKWILENAFFDSPCPPVKRPVIRESGGLLALLASVPESELLATAWRSIYVSLAATAIATLWSMPAAIILAFSMFRFREAVEVGFQALTGVPTVIIGLVFYLILVRSGPLGGIGILYTTEAMIIASSVLVTPILVSLIAATLRSSGRDVREAALTVGASRLRAGLEVLHDLRVPIAVAILIAFTRAIGELGVAFMVGGDIRFNTRVLSTAIAFETSRGNWEIALLFSGVLLVIVLVASTVSVRLARNGIRRRAT